MQHITTLDGVVERKFKTEDEAGRASDQYFPKRNADGSPSYREHQRETIVSALLALEEVDSIIIDAPVGAGKSAINYALARNLGTTVMMTSQKALQNQLDTERFDDTRALKGRNEYHCPFVSAQLKGKDVSADCYEFRKCKSCQKCEETDTIVNGSAQLTKQILESIFVHSRGEDHDRRSYYSGCIDPVEESVLLRDLEKAWKKTGAQNESGSPAGNIDSFALKSIGCHMATATYCCPYKVAKFRLKQARVRVMNPDGFYYQKLADPSFDADVDCLIFDEAHTLDDAINRIMNKAVPIQVTDTIYGLGWEERLAVPGILSSVFRERWRVCYDELQQIYGIAVLAKDLSPLMYSLVHGHTLNVADPEGAKLCISFRKGMNGIKSKSVLEVLSSGAYMYKESFEDFRECVRQISMVPGLPDETGKLTMEHRPKPYMRSFTMGLIQKTLKSINRHNHIEDDDTLTAEWLYKLKNSFDSKYFPGLNDYIETNRDQEGHCVFVPEVFDGPASYGHGLEYAEGYNELNETMVSLVCIDPGVILRKYFYGSKKLVFSSGTWLQYEKDVFGLGLFPSKTKHIKVPSTFPANRRPLYAVPAMDFSHQVPGEGYMYKSSRGMKVWIDVVDRLVSKIWETYPDANIAMHTNSFDIMYLLSEYAMISKKWYFHCNGKPREVHNRRSGTRPQFVTKDQGVMELMNNPKTGRVLVSPSIKEGVDFKADICRCQIVIKSPIPNMGDVYVKSISRGVPDCGLPADKDYITRRILRDMTQMYGRVMRSQDDAGLTFVIDKKLIQALEQARFSTAFNTEYVMSGLKARIHEHKAAGIKQLVWDQWKPLTED